MKKKIFFIINPISGILSKESLPELINKSLDPNLFEKEILFTQFAGHAAELTQMALRNNADYIVAVGGDGTVNEIARNMVHTNAALGILPSGSGNGLARDLGIPMDIKRALKVIAKPQISTIDYGKANDHFFFCTCGFGFDAMVSERFSEEKTRGPITYVRSAISEYIKFKPETYTLEFEAGKSIDEKAFLITFANASQYGNNAYIAPEASMSDGKMDVVVLAPFHAIDAGPIAVQLFTKQIVNNNRVTRYLAEKVILNRTSEGPMHVDGDPVHAGKQIVIQTIPSGLKVITPHEGQRNLLFQNQITDIQLFFKYLFQKKSN